MLNICRADATLACGIFIVLANGRQPAIQRFLVGLDDSDWNTDIGHVHGDTAPHSASANYAGFRYGDFLNIFTNTGYLAGLPLGEEKILLSSGLGSAHKLHEQLGFRFHPLIKRLTHRRFDAANVMLRGEEPPGLLSQHLASLVENFWMLARAAQFFIAVAHARMITTQRRLVTREGQCCSAQITLNHGIYQSMFQSLSCRDGHTGGNHFQGLFHTYRARQALGATTAG